ncbi:MULTISPECIES: CoA ester lyase [unclassified Pseudoxanthomonas]|uniref:HpcH/HpaI aldolase/citrate lyase family protein n=1 Tax=unclassified Pseudoxanthomonas TaxID=2645906 RepID=UPI0008E49B19|nr:MULTISPECIES: CoA ester lyase [unclassified Pseudoxanthomonas]PPJ41437.1 CoA ester lyase [Pseudoxanthomonas sp. KAs_5_3]SFV30306.1 citrate lyase subunit beta / citryl-CoA lyase [Pseudoxanthomonas sp. YR558]
MRSKLFVPGSRPALFAKAMAGDADLLSLDLEDAVAGDDKATARQQVAAFLQSAPHRAAGKQVVVRVNAWNTSAWEDDLRAILPLDIDLLNLPKIESADQLRQAMSEIDAIEARLGVRRSVGILVNIETPRALRHAAKIALAHPRIRGLQLGLGDLFEPHGIRRTDLRNVHAAQYALRMAAAEAGAFAYDAAFPGLEDEAGFRAEADAARALGFAGKSCVHPRQVAWANDIFAPSAKEIDDARRTVQKADEAGEGAFAVDGRMVDAPFLARARAVLALVDRNKGTA